MTGYPSGYKPEIDGLRALAVLAVILFHLQVPGFGGGYVGVDVFLVISGYLITRNIRHQLACGEFRLRSFYANRIRRLFPALLVTVIGTLVAGYFLFTPAHYARLGQSAVSAIFSFSNIFFWLESGYFDTSKAFKPLLHTWSLSLEEQFYLLWPALLLALSSRSVRTAVTMILATGLTSLVLAERFIGPAPASVFYLVPFRIVEFALGALLVLLPEHRKAHGPWLTAAILGLGAIACPVVFYSDQTSFPGISSLLPCVGAALLIRYGAGGPVGTLLRNGIMVWTGKISYSLYLVHWPVIVFVGFWKLGGIGAKSMIVVLPFILILSVLLHYSVEQRFRYVASAPGRKHSRRFAAALVSLALVVAGAGLSISAGEGWIWRYSAESREVIQAVNDLDTQAEDKEAFYKTAQKHFDPDDSGQRILVIGDSFAQDFFIALKLAYPELNARHVPIRAICQPVIEPGNDAMAHVSAVTRNQCKLVRAEIFNRETLSRITGIVLSASWRDPAFSGLADTVKAIRALSEAPILLVGARTSYHHDVPTLAIRHGRLDQLNEFVDQYRLPGQARTNDRLRDIAADNAVPFLDIHSLLCPDDTCPVISPEDGQIMYSDHAHWKLSGAALVADRLKHHPLAVIGTACSKDSNTC